MHCHPHLSTTAFEPYIKVHLDSLLALVLCWFFVLHLHLAVGTHHGTCHPTSHPIPPLLNVAHAPAHFSRSLHYFFLYYHGTHESALTTAVSQQARRHLPKTQRSVSTRTLFFSVISRYTGGVPHQHVIVNFVPLDARRPCPGRSHRTLAETLGSPEERNLHHAFMRNAENQYHRLIVVQVIDHL